MNFHCDSAISWRVNHRYVPNDPAMRLIHNSETGRDEDLYIVANQFLEDNLENTSLIQCISRVSGDSEEAFFRAVLIITGETIRECASLFK